mgnify:CR=1 FL=1
MAAIINGKHKQLTIVGIALSLGYWMPRSATSGGRAKYSGWIGQTWWFSATVPRFE